MTQTPIQPGQRRFGFSILIKRIPLILLPAVPLLALELLLYATVPPGPDQHELDYMAWMIMRGGVPYVDFVTLNWPGAILIHTLATALFGSNLYSWRIMDFLIMLAGVIAAYRLLLAMWNRPAAVCMIYLYPLLYICQSFHFAGQRDLTASHILLISLWSHWLAWSADRPRFQIITGFTIAAAVLIKPTVGVLCPLLLLHGLLLLWGKPSFLRSAVIHVSVVALAALTTIAASLILLLLLGTPLTTLWVQTVLFNAPAYRLETVTLSHLSREAFQAFIAYWHWMTLLATISLIWIASPFCPRSIASRTLIPLLLLTGLLSYIIQDRALIYHLGPAFTASLFLMFMGLGSASAALSLRFSSPVRAFALLLLLLPVALLSVHKARNTFTQSARLLTGLTDRRDHLSRYGGGGSISMDEAVLLSQEFQGFVPEEGTILIFSRASIINILADRPQPTRFHHYVVLLWAQPPFPFAQEWHRLFQTELRDHPPTVCLIDLKIMNRDVDFELDPRRFLRRFLAEEYRLHARVGGCEVYYHVDTDELDNSPR